jgi:hypothetical protein
MLDRDAHSYSEFKTFSSSCKLQHFYRYYMKLEGARFQDVQYFIIGRIVHQAIEDIYHGEDKEKAVNSAAQNVLLDMRDDIVDFDRHAFDIKREVARNMVDVFEEEIFAKEPFELEDTEVYFEEPISGIPFRGHVDRIYRLSIDLLREDDRIYDQVFDNEEHMDRALDRALREGRDFLRFIGEEKTRSSSSFPSGSSYKDDIKGDLQTHLYMKGLEKAGMPVDGIVHTSYRKAPSKYRDPEKYDNLAEQKEAIDGYYSRARTPVRRVQMVWAPPEGELESYLQTVKGDMEEFYKEPFESVDSFIKHDPERYPCAFCAYRRICHGNDEIDDGFRYKTE